MSDEATLLLVMQQLYAAVAAPELWASALEGVSRLVGAGHTVLVARNAAGADAPLLAAARVDERDLVRAFAALEVCDPGPLARLPQGTAVTRSALVSDRHYTRTAHFNEVVRPLNGFHGLMAQESGPMGGFAVVSCRAAAADDFTAADASIMQRLLPHVATALALRRRLRLAELGLSGFAATLDRFEAGVILTDAAGRPTFLNAAASRLIAEADGLALDRAGLAAAHAAATRRLRALVAAMCGTVEAPERQLSLPRPSGRPPLLVTVLPIWRLGLAAAGAPVPQVAVFVREPDVPPAINRQALADAYRLTRREGDVAVLLAQLHDLARVAERLGLGMATVRSHLKSVYAKTGTGSQAALVSLVRGFVGPPG